MIKYEMGGADRGAPLSATEGSHRGMGGVRTAGLVGDRTHEITI
jgi:hypothetical protein